MYQDFLKNMKLHNCFQHQTYLIIIINVSREANHHIRMISEGSRDTEDWSNDAENSALITGINYILKYIQLDNT